MSQKRLSVTALGFQRPRLHRHPSLPLQPTHPHSTFKSLLQTSLQAFSCTHTLIRWQLQKLQQKTRLHGLKARLLWLDLKTKHSVKLKICVPSHFDNIKSSKAIDTDDFLLQLEELNFRMEPRQMKILQNFLDEQIKRQVRAVRHVLEDEWILPILENVSKRLLQEEKREEEGKLNEVVKSKVGENYIMCPAPVAIAWSSQGNMAVSVNQFSLKVQGSFIGTKRFLNFAFQGGRRSSQLMKEESSLASSIAELEETQPTALYDWDINEDLDFLGESSCRAPQMPQIEPQPLPTRKSRRPTQHTKKTQNLQLLDLTTVSPDLSKFYRQYFSRPTPQPHCHPGHIQIYRIEGQDKRLQNDLLYLLYRIADSKDQPIVQVLMRNQMAGCLSIVSSWTDPFQYGVIRRCLIEKISNRKSQAVYLKAMILENQLVSQLLKRHFIEIQARLGLGESQPSQIAFGSYIHFEFAKAQKNLFKILKALLNKNQTQQSKGFTITTLQPFPSFHPLMIITEPQQLQFCKRILPILQTQSHNASTFSYRQIRKIIVTNSQLRNFIAIMNQMIELYDDKSKREFLVEVVNTYERMMDGQLRKPFVRRFLRFQCLRCGHKMESYDILGEALFRCVHCHQSVTEE